MKLSIVIPAYNEEENVRPTLQALVSALRNDKIDFEIVLVNDAGTDSTPQVVSQMMAVTPEVVMITRKPPGGFGRAVRAGLAAATGDVATLFMADRSDDPADVVKCFRLIEQGYDCVYGSRFLPGSSVHGYPKLKLVINRIVNRMMQVMFLTRHNDLSNAFKMYRMDVIRAIGPLHACHFNITIELSLAALVRGFRIASVPVSWNGRTWGCSNLRLKEMGRRYLCTLIMIWCESLLIRDDLSREQEPGVEITRTPRGSD